MEQAALTPKDFGLKVRSHPDTLIVTARNKMGSSKEVRVSVGLSDKLIETTWLARGAALDANRAHTAKFVAELLKLKPYDTSRPQSAYLWRDIPATQVVDYISGFINCDTSLQTETRPVAAFISAGATEELGLWDVAVIGTAGSGGVAPDESLGLPVFLQSRTCGLGTTARAIMVSSRRRVSAQGIERLGLSDALIEAAEAQYREDRELSDGAAVNYPDSAYRKVRPRPLLMIHLLEMRRPLAEGAETAALVEPEPVVAWGISFPPTPETNKTHRTVEYVVNTTWWREHFGEEPDEELESDA